MSGATVKVHGLKELQRELKRLPDHLQKRAIRGAVKAGAMKVRKEARNAAAEDTGNLKQNIRVRVSRKRGQDRVTYRVGVTKDAFYGMFLEFGTKKMAPRPFLRPALDEHYRRVIEIVRERLARAIRQYRK